MIEAVHADLSISAQCRLLSISRSSFYYAPQPESDETLALLLSSVLQFSAKVGFENSLIGIPFGSFRRG
jgi:hypothetical protein